MILGDVPIGELCFSFEQMDGEIRETFYERISQDKIIHHGCIQSADDGFWPRIMKYDKLGREYPIVPRLPARSIDDSVFLIYTIQTKEEWETRYDALIDSLCRRVSRTFDEYGIAPMRPVFWTELNKFIKMRP